jgi:hypothetical protein
MSHSLFAQHARVTLWCALSLCAACAGDAMVGSNEERRDGGQGAEASDGERTCEHVQELPSLPAEEPTLEQSPALYVESARGSFGNAQGDTLVLDIASANQRREITCIEEPDVGDPTAPGVTPTPDNPHVSFVLSAQVHFRSADGAWDERFPVALTLASQDNGEGIVLEGRAQLALDGLGGSFRLPSADEAALTKGDTGGRKVEVRLHFLDQGWILDRWVLEEPRPDGPGGLLGPEWSAYGAAFVRQEMEP